ncbi:MAG: tRNA guanosine(34) transglycosylase Tgt, partial [Bacilli bacterium]|nr:tRNA guanosine(34) transglycosylase Tgt [Bacilli bacterium]
MKVKYQLLHQDGKARYGTLETNYGKFETPMFMPVGTQATVKTLDPRELKEASSAVILSNTYHLWLRPGEDIVNKAGGLHQFMNYDGPILTDSGGFQVFSLAKPKDISEEGVIFKSHLNGEKLFLTPEKSIDIQNKLDSDIAMSFDECIPYPATYEYAKKSTERTLRWAKRGLAVHQNERQSLFGIVQGGEYQDLREWSAKETSKLNFDGYSIGGTSVGEDKKTMYKMIDDGIRYLPEDKPRYLMGVGDPIDIVEEGVHFKSHLNGEKLFLTPEKSIEIQNKLDSDIAMSFDECIPYPATYEYAKKSTERTLRWAERGKKVHSNPRQSLFGIVQGGEYQDLREWSAKETVKLGFDGYSIGGTSVGEDKKTMYKMIEDGICYLPNDKPRYLMGVGDPIDILEGV